jgi:hypothetical protein
MHWIKKFYFLIFHNLLHNYLCWVCVVFRSLSWVKVLTHSCCIWSSKHSFRLQIHSALFTNGNFCLFQLEIYSLFYIVQDDHYLSPLFFCECQVLMLHHLNPSVPIQSCKAEKQFLCVSFHSADWRSKYLWIVFIFSKLWMNRQKVPSKWHVYLHSPNILCINQLIFITW